MKRIGKIKKFLGTALLLGLSLMFFVSVKTAFAGLCDDISDATKGFISCGDEEVTFTEFEGGLQPPEEAGYEKGLTRAKTVREYAVTVTNFALGFLGLIGMIMIIYGGFLYLTAQGEQDQVDKGKKTLTYAVIGMIVVMASFAIVNTVIQAPSGEEGPGAAGEEGEIAGAGIQKRFNYLASQLKTIGTEMITSYMHYDELANKEIASLESIIETAWNYEKYSPAYLGDISSDIDDLKTQLGTITKHLETISKMSAGTSRIKEIVDKLKIIINRFENSILDVSENYCKSQSCCPAAPAQTCDTKKLKEALKEAQNKWNEFKKVLYGASPAYNYFSQECKEEKDFMALMFGQPIPEKCKIYIGTKQMKEAAKEDFYKKIDGYKKEIKEIYGSVAGVVEAAEQLFGLLVDLNELKKPLEVIDALAGKTNLSDAGGYLQKIKENIAADTSPVGVITLVIQTLSDLHEIMKDIQFVDTRLTADIAEGNAPLIVNFSTVGSADPSGLTIKKEQITWDLYGDGFEKEASAAGAACSQSEEAAFASCTFTIPGTYRVGVKIISNEEINPKTGQAYSKDIAPGISYITIEINPPSTQIELKMESDDADGPVSILHYKEGLPVVDKKDVYVSLDAAKKGITFDAAETKVSTVAASGEEAATEASGEANKLFSAKWDFGDGSEILQGEATQENLKPTHTYTKEGTFKVLFEITDRKGSIDRKFFNLHVRTTVAIMLIQPGGEIKVGTKVKFDASPSKSESGEIKAVKWTIKRNGEEVDLGDNEKKETFEKVMEKAGTYEITLEVKDYSDSEASVKETLSVFSQPPIANFRYKMPEPNEPSLVYFDASSSYDPDEAKAELDYEWDFGGAEDTDYVIKEEGKRPVVQYSKKGTYDVALTVTNISEDDESDPVEIPVEIKNVLSAKWAEDQMISDQLKKPQPGETESAEGGTKVEEGGAGPKAEFEFKIEHLNAVSVEWSFGDGETEITEVKDKNIITHTHTYTSSGKKKITAILFDEEDNDISISRNIFIGDGASPIAAARIHVDGSEQFNFEKWQAGENLEIETTRKSVVTFDASDSLNTDGTGRKLSYEWQFGDGKNSTQKSVTHTYRDVDLMVGGEFDEAEGTAYKVLFGRLIVRDKEDSSKRDDIEFTVKVISSKPTLKSFTAVIVGAGVETPLDVEVEVIGAEDPDGQIVQYRWFYFDAEESDVILGQQITKDPKTRIKIGPRGQAGAEKTYRFDVEMTDDENTKVFAGELLPETLLPKATVINGPNEPPAAKFNVDKTTVKVGEVLNFVSTSEDPDGDIVEYMWDLDGDGFENDKWTNEETVEFKFTKSRPDGIKIRLKVRDNNFTEATSTAIMIYVTSNAEPPKAAFIYKQTEDTKTVKFTNNSTADILHGAAAAEYIWDFDTKSTLNTADSDGDGAKDNDKDSKLKDPLFTYAEYGTYYVKLTVLDTEGNEDEVTNIIDVKGEEPVPGSDLDARLKSIPAASADAKIHLQGTAGDVTFDFSESTGKIVKYAIDKNILYDTNGNGVNDDEEDFASPFPVKWTTHFEKSWGKTVVRLTVYDAAGNKDSVEREIIFDAPQGGVSVLMAGGFGRILPHIGIILFAVLTAISLKIKNYG